MLNVWGNRVWLLCLEFGVQCFGGQGLELWMTCLIFDFGSDEDFLQPRPFCRNDKKIFLQKTVHIHIYICIYTCIWFRRKSRGGAGISNWQGWWQINPTWTPKVCKVMAFMALIMG